MQYIQLQGQVAAELDLPISGAFNLFVDTSDNTIKLKDENGNLTGGALLEDLTYSELYNLWDEGTLTAGQYYKITDYQTCYDQPNWDTNGNSITTGNYKLGPIEPLVVFATSTQTLAPNAYSLDYPKDTIKYDISFNQTEVTNGLAKGRIYERIDEVGNRTDYDWRNVQFKRYVQYYSQNTFNGKVTISTTETTGSVTGVDTNFESDFSVGDVLGIFNPNNNAIGGFDFYEVIEISGSNYMGVTGSYYYDISDTYYSRADSISGGSPFQTNTVSVGKEEIEYYTFHLEGNPTTNGWTNNYLGDNIDFNTFKLSNNVFRDGQYIDNYFGSNVVGNTFDDDFTDNQCGAYFQYNTITNDFDSNRIGDNFHHNFIRCDFQENIIGSDFYYNMLTDDDGVDFNQNLINGNYFSHNWFIGYNNFTNNTITDYFENNILYRAFENNIISGQIYNNLFISNTQYNQFKQRFSGNKIYNGNTFTNNILTDFYDNIILDDFRRNQLNGSAYENTFSGSFFDNTVGDYFYNNTFAGIAAYNQIGTGFNNNTISFDFGVGYGNSRANKIGNNVANNNIGEYFYSNTISDNFTNNNIGQYFQQNTVLANGINNIDFTQSYRNIVNFTLTNPNIGEVADGTFTNIPTTTNGNGTGATFDVTISNGVATATLNQSGILYNIGDMVYMEGSIFNSNIGLDISVDLVNTTPVVYQYFDTTIVRNIDGDLKATYLTSGGIGWTDITEQVD